MKPVYWYAAPAALLLIFAAVFLFRSQGEINAASTSKSVITPDQLAPALLKGRFDWVYAKMNANLRKNITKEEFKSAMTQFQQGVVSYTPEIRFRLNGSLSAIALSQDKSKGYRVVYDANKQISGFLIQSQLSRDKVLDTEKTKNTYSLPFKGNWFVFWGGKNSLVNYHYTVPAQRYAADLVRTVNGYTYQGDVRKNESYFAYGQRIVAPEDGIVVSATDQYADNVPVGTVNPDIPPEGNSVVIDHGNGEYSLLAHLKKGSTKVKKGDTVKKGDLIGACGNSGNSSEPHLHFQVSDNPVFTEGKSLFVRYKDNTEVLIGRTLSGQK